MSQAGYHTGIGRAHMVSEAWIDDLNVALGADMPLDADFWFSYFAHATTTAGTWSPEPFGVVFQRITLQASHRLEHHPGALYPDLSELGIETTLREGQPAVRLVMGASVRARVYG